MTATEPGPVPRPAGPDPSPDAGTAHPIEPTGAPTAVRAEAAMGAETAVGVDPQTEAVAEAGGGERRPADDAGPGPAPEPGAAATDDPSARWWVVAPAVVGTGAAVAALLLAAGHVVHL